MGGEGVRAVFGDAEVFFWTPSLEDSQDLRLLTVAKVIRYVRCDEAGQRESSLSFQACRWELRCCPSQRYSVLRFNLLLKGTAFLEVWLNLPLTGLL